MVKTRLTPRQRVFVAEYLVSFNARQAAIKAGISERSADARAQKWLKKDQVTEAIEGGLRSIEATAGINAERVRLEMARIATVNMKQFFRRDAHGELEQIPLDQLPDSLAAAICEVIIDEVGGGTGDGERRRVLRTRFKLCPKNPALEMLGRTFGMFVDRSERTDERRILFDVTERMRQALLRQGKPATVEAQIVRSLPEPAKPGADQEQTTEANGGSDDKPPLRAIPEREETR